MSKTCAPSTQESPSEFSEPAPSNPWQVPFQNQQRQRFQQRSLYSSKGWLRFHLEKSPNSRSRSAEMLFISESLIFQSRVSGLLYFLRSFKWM
jgi:hypothetical protein